MSESGRVLHPTASHLLLILFVLAGAILRLFLFEPFDFFRCKALLNQGQWLDHDPHTNWQPHGCMLNTYTCSQISDCAQGRHIVFVGDSTVRQLYYGLVKTVEPTFDTIAEKHSDRSVSINGVTFTFHFDPFLNGTNTSSLLDGTYGKLRNLGDKSNIPSMAIFGSGLWYLRQPESGGVSTWQAKINEFFSTVQASPTPLADEVVLLPIQHTVEDKLRPDRAETLRNDAISSMNDHLRLREAGEGRIGSVPPPISIPWVFNTIIADLDKETEDGLHFSDSVTMLHSNILLNLRCNDELSKKPPIDKTCCRRYPPPNFYQSAIIILLLIVPPLAKHHYSTSNNSSLSTLSLSHFLPPKEVISSIAILGLSVTFMYLTDRTSLFLKEQKHFDLLQFTLLVLAALIAGIMSMKKPEKDLGFLNRDQTDEWKGWMQIAILIYHYLGASKVSGIYNSIRVLVAAYLFMTGYGHFFFYYKKADYSFKRVASVLIRLNLLAVVLAYVMDTDWLSLYFSPLVSMHYVIIWVVMWLGHSYNTNLPFLLTKLFLSMTFIAYYFTLGWPMAATFDIFRILFNTHWISREWQFRVTLDLYAPYLGMLTALVFIKVKEWKLSEEIWWPQARKGFVGLAALGMTWFFWFSLTRSKFDYNVYHPYVSGIPVLSFAILRNATPYLRSTSSRFFIYFGQCSLETFIIQFNLWLAADTKGILMMIPAGGPNWRPINFVVSSLIFVFVSYYMSRVTQTLTDWICNGIKNGSQTPLPTTTTSQRPQQPSSSDDGTAKPSSNSPSTATTGTTTGMFMRFRDTAAKDLRVKCGLIMLFLIILNHLYPTEMIESHILPTH